MTILWTEPALDDLKAIRDYIARDSETYVADISRMPLKPWEI